MNPEDQAALLAEWHDALPRVIAGEDEPFWPKSFERVAAPPPPIHGRDVIRAVALAAKVPIEHLTGATRCQPIADYRQMCYSLIAELCPWQSTAMIGRLFDRDHTTIMYGCRVYPAKLRRSPELQGIETRARAIIGGG